MKINTKYGPGALLMDNTGGKMGVCKKVAITMKDGDQQPQIIYEIHGNGTAHNLTEAECIQLIPRGTTPVVEAPVPTLVQEPPATVAAG